MTLDPYNLHRFIEAQEGVYPQALEELQDGRKRSHWMWYILPQLAGLGRSYNSNYYGISGLKEAKSYLEHPVLGPRLREVSETILSLPTDNAAEVFGGIDSMKLRSSMTLFDLVSPKDTSARVLEKYFSGCPENHTISILQRNNEPFA